jgi:hypothetical protein
MKHSSAFTAAATANRQAPAVHGRRAAVRTAPAAPRVLSVALLGTAIMGLSMTASPAGPLAQPELAVAAPLERVEAAVRTLPVPAGADLDLDFGRVAMTSIAKPKPKPKPAVLAASGAVERQAPVQPAPVAAAAPVTAVGAPVSMAALATAPAAPGRLGSPLAERVLTSPFGYRASPITGVRGELHTGQDFAAGCGTAVMSAAPGTVSFAGWHAGGGGNRVVVDHGNGLQTTYNHLAGANVVVGQAVSKSAAVGSVGTTGASTGCHLHFEVVLNGAVVDPAGWL